MALTHFIDGDCICIVRDDFTNLQESPAVFVLKDTLTGTVISSFGLNPPVSQVFEDILATKKKYNRE